MRFLTLSRLLSALACAALIAPAAASAAPPSNDNYLASEIIRAADGSLPLEYGHSVDTSEATVQPDILNPTADGQTLGGGPAETTTCGQTQYGKTVWYDFRAPTAGGVELVATGFNTVVAVYEFDPATTRITRTVGCQNDSAGASETVLIPEVEEGKSYTVQIGGAADAGGPLDFRFTFFPDRDADGILDQAPDRCPDQQGIDDFGGCPPELRANPRLNWVSSSGGVQFRLFALERLPRGARVELRCRRCGVREVVRARGTSLRLRRILRLVPNGATIEVRVTRARSRSGRYRFGAIGNYFRYRVAGASVGRRVTRCLRPGSTVPRRRCTP